MLYRLGKTGESFEAQWPIGFQARVHGVWNYNGDSENRNEHKKESSKINQVLGNGGPREGRVRMTGACLRGAGRRTAKQRSGAKRKWGAKFKICLE